MYDGETVTFLLCTKTGKPSLNSVVRGRVGYQLRDDESSCFLFQEHADFSSGHSVFLSYKNVLFGKPLKFSVFIGFYA